MRRSYESIDWISNDVSLGSCFNGDMLPVSRGLRQNLGRMHMIYFVAVVAALLFIYLFVALVRPEWF